MAFTILKNLRRSIAHITQTFKLNTAAAPTGRPRKISVIDALSLALYQHQSTRSTKISVYRAFKQDLRCSYKTFVVSINAVAVLAARVLFLIMRLGRTRQHLVKYTDATDIPVCLKKNADKHKTMAAFAELGRSAKGWYFGLKLTITRDADGRLLAFRFTRANANDRDICRHINKDIFGIIVMDAGYVSKDLERDMNIEHKRWLLIRPYKTMKKIATKWQEDLYKGRFQIEFDFRSLKMFHGLATSMPRSVNGYLANYLHSLLSFVLA